MLAQIRVAHLLPGVIKASLDREQCWQQGTIFSSDWDWGVLWSAWSVVVCQCPGGWRMNAEGRHVRVQGWGRALQIDSCFSMQAVHDQLKICHCQYQFCIWSAFALNDA
eukprot:11228346-Lingulodinium_polyedra.AAC.2